jgi:hypothetical protein
MLRLCLHQVLPPPRALPGGFRKPPINAIV